MGLCWSIDYYDYSKRVSQASSQVPTWELAKTPTAYGYSDADIQFNKNFTGYLLCRLFKHTPPAPRAVSASPLLKFTPSRKKWLAWATLGIGLLATVFASLQVKQGIEQGAVKQFAFTCDHVTLKIHERLAAYSLILRGGVALFAASKAVDRQEWRAYVETLRADGSVPGVQGIGFAQVIPPHQLAAHIARIRGEGFPDYTVRPPGERPLYTSIIYLEPFRDRNLRAFGFDMFSEPVRRAAMEQARDSGVAALSGKVELVQETGVEVQAGTLMYVPVYRNGAAADTVAQRQAALLGWVYSPYRMNDLMTGILGDWQGREGNTVDLQIYDGGEATPATLLLDNKPANTPDVHSLFYQQRTVDFNGRQWLLVFDLASTASGIDYAPAWAALAGGLTLSGMLFGLILAVTNTRASAVRIADKLTEEIIRSKELLQENEAKIRLLMNSTAEAIYGIDMNGDCTFCNDTCLRLLGYQHTDNLLGLNMHWQIHGKYADGSCFPVEECRIFQAFNQGKCIHVDDEVLWRSDGTSFPAEYWSYPQSQDGVVVGAVVTFLDITERKQVEEKLHLAASVFTHSWEGIMITAADCTILDVNDAFSRITSYSRDDVLGQNPRILSSGHQENEFYAEMWRRLVEEGQWHGEVWNRRKNGEVYAVMQTVSVVRDGQGNIRQYVALFSDITSIKEHENQLEHIAHFDALTGLPNRVLLADRIYQGMAQAQRSVRSLAVAYLDLDGFKAINDNHGHEAGDQLLITASARIKQTLREGDTFARIGGDEFVAVLLDLADVTACTPTLTRLLTTAAQPVHVGDLVLQVSASLGVTFYPQAEDIDADQLLRQADQAMYQAKLAGKNRYHVFDAEQDSSIRSHHESLERIRRALLDREFVLYYQPKVNMRTGTVIGAEALIRWQHPENGLLPPSAFLPVIEDHPLAVELGEWVVDSALAQMELWQTVGLDIPVSVNVGAHQLQQVDFVERLGVLLAAHPNVRPDSLELEVLETSTLELVGASLVIEACREIGVLFALDDFGTGYSSLTYLKRLPVAQIKIDQSFVRDMLDDPDDLAILEGVIGLAAAFRRQVVAEGVETVEHGKMLLQLGCELAQGYGIARPMPPAGLPSWSAAWHPDPAWINCRPVSRDDLPLLFASAEHRAWIVAVESYLKGEREAPPPLDHHQCRFGRWLDADGLIRHGAQPAFPAIWPLHSQVHALAAELCEYHARGGDQAALARLGELHGLWDALLGQLKKLVLEIRQY